MQRGKNEHL